MSEPQTVRWPWAVWAFTLCLVAAALTLSVANETFGTFVAIAVPMMIGYGTIGAFVSARVRGNPIGWLMLTVGLSFGLIAISSEYLVWAVRNDAPLQAVSAWLSNWVYVLTFSPLPTILLLFPTGRVLSPRWRIVLYGIAGSAAALAVAAWIRPGDVGAEVPFANPTGVQALNPLATVLSTIGLLGIFVSTLASVAALIVRYRASADTQRRQIRALAYVAGVAVVLLVPAFVTEGSPVLNDVFFYAFFICIGVAFPAAIGWAILRYRLYDIDLVVKKTVTFSLVALALIGLYLALIAVATLGNVSRLLFGIGVIVLTFRPVLGAARSIADRVVYGRRATPYEVMSEFSERMSETYSTEDVLPLMVHVLQGATGAERAEVWLRIGRQLEASASSSSDSSHREVVEARDDTLPSLPGSFAARGEPPR